jgi:hypothetical protein
MPRPELTERQFQKQVVELATMLGWESWHHLYSPGTRSGVPDLHLLRERLVVVELKRRGGKTTPAQDLMLGLYRKAGVETYVWRPDDWDEIVAVLRRKV